MPSDHPPRTAGNVSALSRYGILDTPPEAEFDDIARVAAELLDAPMAAITLLTAERQFHKAELGLGTREIPLEQSFCNQLLDTPEAMVVPDAAADPRFAGNPLVTGAPGVRFYAGAPLRTREGQALGALCVLDTRPRPAGLDARQDFVLRTLAQQAGSLLELRRTVRERDAALAAQRRTQAITALLSETSAGLLNAAQLNDVLGPVLERGAGLLGFDAGLSYVLAADGEHLELDCAHGLDAAALRELSRIPLATTSCGLVVESRAPVVLQDVAHDTDPRFELPRRFGALSYAGFPLEAGGRMFGVLTFASWTQTRFDEEALTFFATLARYVAVVRERLDKEAMLRDAATRLESRVEERTAELRHTEERLRQSQKMEAVGQLTGGVAHDFNNLLTIIRSSVDFLRRQNLSEERRQRYVEAIADTVERAAKLTGQLLAFARRQPLKPEVFDVSERVRGVAEMVRPLVGARVSIELSLCEHCGGPCFAEADLSQFETALVNLAVNARDAMEGEGRLFFSVRKVGTVPPIRGHAGAAGDFVAIALRDTGSGIPPDKLDAIFEPFFTTKEVGRGTGLGLSQVFGFVKQSGGEVEVGSQPGIGSTFTIYLPRVPAPARPGSAEAGEAEQDGGPDPLCVLVVEDNKAVGEFATEMLRDLGYGTRWAGSADQALALLAADGARTDVVFTDVVMPGMNGVELARTIRGLHPELPVVLTSGYSSVLAQDSHHGFELLRKPYSVEALSRVLRKVTSRPGAN